MYMSKKMGKGIVMVVLMLAIFGQVIVAQELTEGTVEKVEADIQSAPVNPFGPVLIGTGLASTITGGVFLIQSLPLKAEADRLYAASSATPATASAGESGAASMAFYSKFALGIGCTVTGLALTSLGFWISNSDMDYTRVSPPVESGEAAVKLSFIFDGSFAGLSLSR